MKKSKIANFLVSALLLLAVTCTSVLCGCSPLGDVTDLEKTDALETSIMNTEYVKLEAEAPMLSRSSGTISQRITATVLPETASNKKVDWSVCWGDENIAEDVTEYVNVIPDSDGSASATVTCKNAFEGNIIITATTRQNGYRADCIVTFVGVPANVDIVTTLTPAADGYHVSVGNTYTFGTELSNPFGEVGSEYKTLNVSVEGVGKIKVADRESYSNGEVYWYEDSAKTIPLNDIVSKFVEATIATDGTVTVNVKKSIESYYSSVERLDAGRTTYHKDHFMEYVTACSIKIVLTEPKSGISNFFAVVIDQNAVTGVSLTTAEILF